MASRTNKDEVIESAEQLDTNCPVNTKQQKPGSSAKFHETEGQSQELLIANFERLIYHLNSRLEEKKEIDSLKETLFKKQLIEKENKNQKLTTELASCKKETEQRIKLLQSENSDLHQQIAELDPNKIEIQSLKNLLLIDDYHRKLSKVGLESNLSDNSTSLVIQERTINYVAPGTFDNHSLLTKLELQYCSLTFLEQGVFNNLTNLIYLNLTYNNLTCLKGNVFAGLKKLKWIYLYNNNITKIPPQLFRELESLDYIHLSDNKISVFDENLLVGLNRLTRFYAHNNNLTSIPKKLFGDCVKLEEVYLYNNKIVRLKNTIFDNLQYLKLLYVTNNPLDEMDKNALKMLNIEHFSI